MKKDRNKYALPDHLDKDDIKRMRKKLQMTQNELAELLNVSVKTIENWEANDRPITGPVVLLSRILLETPEMAEYYLIPEKTAPLRLKYYWYNTLCTVIDVNMIQRKVKINNYTQNVLLCAFGGNQKPNYQDYEEFLESRCFPETRDKMKIQLEELDIPYYDPLLIIEKTGGRVEGDPFRVEIERGI